MKSRLKAINNILILNIDNAKINEIFSKLKGKYNKKTPSRPHITLRGPQKEISKEIMEKTRDVLSEINKIEIKSESAIRVFEVSDNYFCVLLINAPNLKKVWRKPDFPIYKYGFNPHITLFKGSKEEADNVKEYVENNFPLQNINILKSELEIESKKLSQLPLDL